MFYILGKKEPGQGKMKASIPNKLHQDSDLCQVNICVNFIAQSIWEVRHRYIGHSTLGLTFVLMLFTFI